MRSRLVSVCYPASENVGEKCAWFQAKILWPLLKYFIKDFFYNILKLSFNRQSRSLSYTQYRSALKGILLLLRTS